MTKNIHPAHLFQRLYIKNKIIVFAIPLIIVPLLILGILSSNMFTKSLINKTERNVLGESSLILTQINSIINNSESCANILTTDLNRSLISFPKERSSIEESQFRNQMQTQLGIDLLIFPDVDSAIFIDEQKHIYTSYPNLNEKDLQIFGTGILEKLEDAGSYGLSYWFPMQLRDFLVTDPNVPVLTLGKKVVDINTGIPMGTLIINVKESSLSNIYTKIGRGGDMNYFILDNHGTVISASKAEQSLKPLNDDSLNQYIQSNSSFSRKLATKNGDDLITSVSFDKMGWKLVHVIPMKLLTEDIKRNTWMTAFIGIVCLLAALLSASVLSRVIVNPLLELTKSMRRVQAGDLDVNCEVHTPDEIGLLSSVFNTMILQIKQLLKKVESDQRMKKEYELALIHAQIKPHFLYNTLDLIYVLNDLNRNQEARDTTKALADYYRVALSKGKEIITIREEMKNARDYLSIQQVRYSDIFDFEMNVPNELWNYEIPKLSIQLILENAIYHGLKPKGSFGHIVIDGIREGQDITIRVKDDGIGMNEETLKGILGCDANEKTVPSFGIFSVHERIQLYFGENYGVSIRSAVGKGTVVLITLPAESSRRKPNV